MAGTSVTGQATLRDIRGKVLKIGPYGGAVAVVSGRELASLNLQITAQREKKYNAENKLAGYAISKRELNLQIGFKPVGLGVGENNTRAVAVKSTELFQDPMIVELSAFEDIAAGQVNGLWLYFPDNQSHTRNAGGEEFMVQMNLERPLDIADNGDGETALTLAELITPVV